MSEKKHSATAPGTVSRETEEFPAIPGFTILRELGKGGMAVVYQAIEHFPKRDVAIKIIRTEYVRDEGYRELFREEANRMAALAHSAILPIYASGFVNDLPYTVTQYAPGGDLREKIDENILTTADRLRIVRILAEALVFAHERAIPTVHLDIKPENILFAGNNPLLADFGVAKQLLMLSQVVKPGTIVGDPRYWAPEAPSGKYGTPSDIYSLGKVFFELLRGKRPETDWVSNDVERDQLINELPPTYRLYGPLIARCMAYKAADRPTAIEVAEELDKFIKPGASSWPLAAAAAVASLAVAGALLQLPAVKEFIADTREIVFPTEQYATRFSIAPPTGRIWVDGRESPFRGVELAEGLRGIAAVADNHVGEYRELSIPVAAGAGGTTFTLGLRPPITDEEYLEFTRRGMKENTDGGVAASAWVDATLANVAVLGLLQDSAPDAYQQRIKGLKALAGAGDEVAQTTLFYLSFDPPAERDADLGKPVELLPGLDMAAAKGYALATVLRALYALDEISTQKKPMAQVADEKAQLLERFRRIEAEGMPQTAAQLAAVLASWEQAPPAGN